MKASVNRLEQVSLERKLVESEVLERTERIRQRARMTTDKNREWVESFLLLGGEGAYYVRQPAFSGSD